MDECAKCVAKHGRPGCPATLTDERGLPVCAWCTDLEPCPVEQRRLKAAKKKPPEETPPAASDENSPNEQKSGVTTMKTPEPDPIPTPKKLSDPESDIHRCRRPGCEKKLSAANVVGLCARHVRWTAPSNGHAEGSNGHAAKTNGHSAPAPTNGNGHAPDALPDSLSARVDEFLASLTPPTKTKIVTMWLRGEL